MPSQRSWSLLWMSGMGRESLSLVFASSESMQVESGFLRQGSFCAEGGHFLPYGKKRPCPLHGYAHRAAPPPRNVQQGPGVP